MNPNMPRLAADRACCRCFAAPRIPPAQLARATRPSILDALAAALSRPRLPRSAHAQPLLPCAPIKGLHRAPAHTRPSTTTTAALALPLDLAIEPHFPLLLRPNRGSKRIALYLLVLPDFPTPPSLAGPPPPTTHNSPELLLTAGSPTPATPAPTEKTNRFPSTSSCSPPLPPNCRLVSVRPGTMGLCT
jgi:hypothetical protein